MWIAEVVKQCETSGEAFTLLAKRRPYPEVDQDFHRGSDQDRFLKDMGGVILLPEPAPRHGRLGDHGGAIGNVRYKPSRDNLHCGLATLGAQVPPITACGDCPDGLPGDGRHKASQSTVNVARKVSPPSDHTIYGADYYDGARSGNQKIE